MKLKLDDAVVCIVGLGYVGLPLAQAFARSLKVIGFDVNRDKVRKLNKDNDNSNLTFTDNPMEISKADFIIICVPTPVTKSKNPDLLCVETAAITTGQKMKKGSEDIEALAGELIKGLTPEEAKQFGDAIRTRIRC